jgi:hypothetical protein
MPAMTDPRITSGSIAVARPRVSCTTRQMKNGASITKKRSFMSHPKI